MFIVKHYSSDERPIIKGHGFNGVEVGEDRDFLNSLLETSHNRDYAKCPSSKACHNYPDFTVWCKECIRLSGLKDHFA